MEQVNSATFLIALMISLSIYVLTTLITLKFLTVKNNKDAFTTIGGKNYVDYSKLRLNKEDFLFVEYLGKQNFMSMVLSVVSLGLLVTLG